MALKYFRTLRSVKGADNLQYLQWGLKTGKKKSGGGPGQLSLEAVQGDCYHQWSGQVVPQSDGLWEV
jgi:hypothetical protein